MDVPTDKDTKVWIQASSRKYGEKRVELDRLEGQDLTITFAETAELIVTVEGIPELDGETISISARAGDLDSKSASCNEERQAIIRGLQPGEVTLGVSMGSGRRMMRQAQVHSERATVTSGKNAIRLTVPPLQDVTITNATSNVWVSHRDRSSARSFHRSAIVSDGAAVIRWIPPGDYMAHSGTRSARFSVPGPSTVELKERSAK